MRCWLFFDLFPLLSVCALFFLFSWSSVVSPQAPSLHSLSSLSPSSSLPSSSLTEHSRTSPHLTSPPSFPTRTTRRLKIPPLLSPSPQQQPPMRLQHTLDKPVKGLGQFFWIVLSSPITLSRFLRTCATRARPVFWTADKHHQISCRELLMGDLTRKAELRERPDGPADLPMGWLTLAEAPCSPITSPSSMSPPRQSGPSPSLNLATTKRMTVVEVLPVPTVPAPGRLAPSIPVREAVDLVLVVTLRQLVELSPVEAVPELDAPGLARLFNVPDSTESVLLCLKHDHPSRPLPTLHEVRTIVASFCLNYLSVFRTQAQVATESTAEPRTCRYDLQALRLPKQTRKCEISPHSILVGGSRNGRKETSTVQTTHNRSRRLRRRRQRREVHQQTNEGNPGEVDVPKGNNPVDPPVLPSQPHQNHHLLPLASLSPLIPPTVDRGLSMSDSDDDNLLVRPPTQLVREALKLETARNTPSVTLVHKINCVRLRCGQTRWGKLREPYPLDIEYEAANFSPLRRNFLSQYEDWMKEVRPRPPPPEELLGRRRSRAPTVDTPPPPPFPVALQDPVTPPQQKSLQIPGSAWISTQGARISRLIANFPRMSPGTPTAPHRQTYPGGFPHSSTLIPEESLLVTAPRISPMQDDEGFLPEVSLPFTIADLNLENTHRHKPRTESLYSDEETDRLVPWNESDAPDKSSIHSEDPRWNDNMGWDESYDDDAADMANLSLVPHTLSMSYYPHQPLFAERYEDRSASASRFDTTTRFVSEAGDDFEELPSPGISPFLGTTPQKPLHSPTPSVPSPTLNTTSEFYHPPPPVSDLINSFQQLSTTSSPPPAVPVMGATFTTDQFTELLKGIKEAITPVQKTSFKDAKIGFFHPSLAVDATHPAGRSCTVNGVTYYRAVRLYEQEVQNQRLVIDVAELTRCLPSTLDGPARTWWRDVLTKEEREAMLKDIDTFLSRLVKQFERTDEDTLSTVFANRFTTARLRNGDDILAWTMEQSTILAEAGLDQDRRVKTLYACLDADLKNEFGAPGSMDMAAYVQHIQTKAYVYREKLQQQEQEAKVSHARTVNDLVAVLRQAQNGRQQAPNTTPQASASSSSSSFVPASTYRPLAPVNITVSGSSLPFSGRPCRHCGGAHLDHTCSSKQLSRPCRFCQGNHMDHSCTQRPAAFRNCGNCGGPHYQSVCPTAPKPDQPPHPPASTPSFSNMQVGQPSPATAPNTTPIGFVQTPHVSEATRHVCGSCQGSFPSEQALYGHAILTGHQIDASSSGWEPFPVNALSIEYPSFQTTEVLQVLAASSRSPELATDKLDSLTVTMNFEQSSATGTDIKAPALVSTPASSTTSANLAPSAKTIPSYLPTISAHNALLSPSTRSSTSSIFPSTYTRLSGVDSIARTNYLEVAIKFKAISAAVAYWICLDTGCGLSLISRRFLTHLIETNLISNVRRLPCSPVPFRGINDVTPSTTNEMVQLTFYVPGDMRIINGEIVDHRDRYGGFCREFLIVPELFCNMILGTDMQTSTGMQLDFHHMALTISSCDSLVTALRVMPKKQAKVTWRVDTAAEACTIAPFATVAVPVCHKPLPPGATLEFTPYLHDAATRQLATVGGFHRSLMTHTTYAVLYTNESATPVIIPPFLRVGHVAVLQVPASQISSIVRL
ncbi:hypothetical protein BJ508DRAFT_303420 [Ascobolus immersus RN42]|uniref:Uncharacterized protein n=1 Tax=Ascobolus immersus RN42 TaxID=1160509 RepID=A0A3N4IFV1_ASCIM|nr:hypothetical protein BJ508DRAFT_303420 [Ascobolus immersus RN42]